MLSKIIKDYLEQSDKVVKYQQALKLLKEAGFFDLIRKFGYPDIIDSGNNPYSMATQAARSHGFQNAVSHMEFFMEMYAFKKDAGKKVDATFGAEGSLLKDKLMTKEELNKLRGGTI